MVVADHTPSLQRLQRWRRRHRKQLYAIPAHALQRFHCVEDVRHWAADMVRQKKNCHLICTERDGPVDDARCPRRRDADAHCERAKDCFRRHFHDRTIYLL